MIDSDKEQADLPEAKKKRVLLVDDAVVVRKALSLAISKTEILKSRARQ